MYGIPYGVDWGRIVGRELEQVCIGVGQLSLRFDQGLTIDIYGSFDHVPDAPPVTPDGGLQYRAQTTVSLLASKVVGVTRIDEQTLELAFSSGESLRIRDDGPQYESFEIHGLGYDLIV